MDHIGAPGKYDGVSPLAVFHDGISMAMWALAGGYDIYVLRSWASFGMKQQNLREIACVGSPET
jgi:hypothetical protein